MANIDDFKANLDSGGGARLISSELLSRPLPSGIVYRIECKKRIIPM